MAAEQHRRVRKYDGGSVDRAMVSALAYHGLTDQMTRKTWVAIGTSDWSPVSDYPPDFDNLSAIKMGHWPITLMACRHYRLPIPPQLWIGLLEEFDRSETQAVAKQDD